MCIRDREQTDEDSIVEVDGERLIYREFVYLMLNKPQGCVSAVYDKKYPVVTEFVPEEYAHFEVYPCLLYTSTSLNSTRMQTC